MSFYQASKVLLLSLSERTSAKGNTYLSGWLGKAKVVGFRGEDDHGNPTWNIYVSEPERRDNTQGLDHPAPTPDMTEHRRNQRAQRNAAAAQRRHDDAMTDLNDEIPL